MVTSETGWADFGGSSSRLEVSKGVRSGLGSGMIGMRRWGVACSALVVCVTVAVLLSGAMGLLSPTSLDSSTARVQGSLTANPPLAYPATLTSPNAQDDGYFGFSVAISGGMVVVGAPDETEAGFSGAGRAYEFSASTGALMWTLTSPNAQTNGAFGISVAISGSLIAVGAPGEFVETGHIGHAYVYDATTGALITTLTGPTTQINGDDFGASVAISGHTVVVGAPLENTPAVIQAGQAFVFKALTGKLISTLTSPNAVTGGDFGGSVGISGATVVAGAPGESAGGVSGTGRAYVFSASGGAPIATLTSPNAQMGGAFGDSVAISGPTVVVGAQFETAAGLSRAGHAYTFTAGTGAPIATMSSPNAQTNGYFGWSVTIAGNYVGVGTPWESASGDGVGGHAYLFDATTGEFLASFTSPNVQVAGEFGRSVALQGGTLVVGAMGETSGGFSGAGNAYLFHTAQYRVTSTVTSPNLQYDGGFGWSVAVSGHTVVVGAPFETPSGDPFGAGHAYIIDLTTGVVTSLTSPNPVYEGEFGYSVAVSGNTVVVGAPGTGASSIGGNAYVFNANTGGLISTLTSPHAIVGGAFGYSVAISGTTIAVGAAAETASGLTAAGHAYVFNASGSAISTLTSPNPQTGGFFGCSVGISGNTVVVGADMESALNQSAAGNAYVFRAATGHLLFTLTSPNAQKAGKFGYSVAISGKTIVVGAPYEAALGLSQAGHAYVFSATTGALSWPLTSPNAQAAGFFGSSVAVNGATIIVGADDEASSGEGGAGNAYEFSASTGVAIATFVSPNAQVDGGFGVSVAVSGRTVVVGAYYETVSGLTAAGHAYVFYVP